MSLFRANYLCAVGLNNMALHLLERHCYQEAFESLRNAASLILSNISPLAKLQSEQVLFALYDQAQKRSLLAKPHMNSPMIIRTITTGLSATIVNSVLVDSIYPNVVHPFKMENRWDEDKIEDVLNFTGCIITYNVAVAYACIAQVTTDAHKGVVTLLNCKRYCELAYNASVVLHDTEISYTDLLHTTMLVVSQCLKIFAFFRLADPGYYEFYLRMLELFDSISTQVLECQTTCFTMADFAAPAA